MSLAEDNNRNECGDVDSLACVITRMPGPLPESLRIGVYEAYENASYGRFMMCVARVQDDTMSAQDVCADVFNILGYDGGRPCDNGNMHGRPCNNGNMHRDHTSKCRRPDLYRKFVEWSTAAPPVVKEEKTDGMPGPLPEGLRMAVYESYPALYGRFMVHVVALQEGTMPLKQVDDDVFQILGYDGGFHQKYGKYVVRDASCISHRPDLYSMFVEWSTCVPPVVVGEKKKVPFSNMLGPRTGEQAVVGKKKKNNNVPFSFSVIGIPTTPAETPCLDAHRMPESVCLDSLTNEVLVKDLIALDAALTMSPTMLTALRVGAGGPSVPVSFGAMRLLWQKELFERVRTDT